MITGLNGIVGVLKQDISDGEKVVLIKALVDQALPHIRSKLKDTRVYDEWRKSDFRPVYDRYEKLRCVVGQSKGDEVEMNVLHPRYSMLVDFDFYVQTLMFDNSEMARRIEEVLNSIDSDGYLDLDGLVLVNNLKNLQHEK
jgi:hypothetical protein